MSAIYSPTPRLRFVERLNYEPGIPDRTVRILQQYWAVVANTDDDPKAQGEWRDVTMESE